MGQSFRFYVHAHAVGYFRDKETLRAEALRPIAATGDEIFAGMKGSLLSTETTARLKAREQVEFVSAL